MRYCVVENHNRPQFEQEVTILINDGWELQGGIHVYTDYRPAVYCQALIKSPRVENKLTHMIGEVDG